MPQLLRNTEDLVQGGHRLKLLEKELKIVPKILYANALARNGNERFGMPLRSLPLVPIMGQYGTVKAID